MQAVKGVRTPDVCHESYKFFTDDTFTVLSGELKTKTAKFSVNDGGGGGWATFDTWQSYVEEATGQAPTPDTSLREAVDILAQLVGPCGNLTQDGGNQTQEAQTVSEASETPSPSPSPKVTRVRKTVTRVDGPGIPHNPQAFMDEVKERVANLPSAFAPSQKPLMELVMEPADLIGFNASVHQLDLREEIDGLIETHGLAAVLSAIEQLLDETATTFQKIGIRRVADTLNKTSAYVSQSAAMLSFMEGDNGSSPSPRV